MFCPDYMTKNTIREDVQIKISNFKDCGTTVTTGCLKNYIGRAKSTPNELITAMKNKYLPDFTFSLKNQILSYSDRPAKAGLMERRPRRQTGRKTL